MEKKHSWVETWGMSHMRLSLMSYSSRKRTFRLVLHTAIAGERARIRLCNRHGAGRVAVGGACVALCDAQGVIADPGSVRPLTFGGKAGRALPPGQTIISDETDFDVPVGAYLCIDLYIKKGRLQSGNNLDNVRLLFGKGDQCGAGALRHKKRWADAAIALAGKILGLSLYTPIPLFQAVELYNGDGASSIECFGDSLTQQGFWTRPFEERIRALYPGRYSVINKAIAGNRILRDTSGRFPLRGFFGVKALERVHDDIFAFEGIGHVIFCHGTNDYFQVGTIAGRRSEFASAEEIAGGVTKLVAMIRAAGIPVVGLNYVPTGLSRDSRPAKNALRRQLNEWFETCGLFDCSFDVAAPFTSAENPDAPPASYVGADRLHPNDEGGRVFAQAIDCGVFAEKTAV